MIMHYSMELVSVLFLSIYYCPYSSWKFQIILSGEYINTTSKDNNGAMHPYNNCQKGKHPLHSSDSYVQPVTQQYKSRTSQKVSL